VVGVGAAIAAGSALTHSRFIDEWSRNPAGEFVANGRASLAAADPEVGVFNTEVDSSVLSRWAFLGLNNTREMFRPVTSDSHGRFGSAGSETMFDRDGRLVPASFNPLTAIAARTCVPIRDGQSRRVAIPRPQTHQDQLTMHLVFRARGEGSLTHSVLAPGETTPGTTPWGGGEVPVVTSDLPVTAGLNSRYILLPPKSVAAFTLDPSGTDVCLEELSVGVVTPD
jgi:hypothetical protein